MVRAFIKDLGAKIAAQHARLKTGKAAMLSYNVICRRRNRGSDQFLCGTDGVTARRVATEESSQLHKGESVTLWSVDTETKTETEIVCLG
jgi:hypothetical protein